MLVAIGDFTALSDVAKSAGFDVTAEELEHGVKAKDGELDDSRLDSGSN